MANLKNFHLCDSYMNSECFEESLMNVFEFEDDDSLSFLDFGNFLGN